MTSFFAKHFRELAQAIGRSGCSDEELEPILDELCRLFSQDNERFNEARFRRAVARSREEHARECGQGKLWR